MLSPLSSSLCFKKNLFCTGQTKTLQLLCLTCFSPCACLCTLFLVLVFMSELKTRTVIWCEEQYSGDPKPVTTTSDSLCWSVLGQKEKKGGEGTWSFKAPFPSFTHFLWYTLHCPYRGMLCKPPGPVPNLQLPFWGVCSSLLSPGMRDATQDAFKYCIMGWSQGSAFEWKTQVSLKELGIWLISKSFCAALLFALSCSLFPSALNWKLGSCFPQAFCYSAQCRVLPSDASSLWDYPQEEKHRTQERKERCKGQLTNDFSEAEWCVILAESPLKRKRCS